MKPENLSSSEPIPDVMSRVETPYGALCVDPEELVIGRLLQENGLLPDITQETAFFSHYLHEGGTAIDVGAAFGLFTLAFAQVVGKAGFCLALEPNEDLTPYWEQTSRANGLDWVERTQVAAGAGYAWSRLRLDPRGLGGTQVVPDEHGGPEAYTAPLEFIITSWTVPRPISVIKIDAEGMDVDVLRGAEVLLEKDRPAVIFEWNPQAMISLGKDPLQEFTRLVGISNRVRYDIVTLDGELWPDPLLGNLGFLPEEGR